MSYLIPFMFDDDFYPLHRYGGHHYNFPAVPSFGFRPSRARNDEEPAFREVVKVHGFKPSDLKVEVSEDKKKVTVSATREEEDDGMKVSRTLNKSLDLPAEADVEKMQKILVDSGHLVLIAPKVKKEEPKPKTEDLLSPISLLNEVLCADSGVDQVKDTEDNFAVNVVAKDFKPEDLTVELSPDKTQLVVKGKHEEKKDGDLVVSRSIYRTYTLPENVKHEEIMSKFGKDGVLSISAPKDPAKKLEEEKKPKSIKINTE